MKHLLQHFNNLTLHPKNAKALKGLILELALKGKLTQTISLDIKEKKEDKVQGYYKLSKNWYWDKFDNVCDFNMGKTPPSKDFEYWGGEYPWISIADMDTYATIYETKKTLSQKGLENYFKNKLVKKGTLLMSFKLTIGKTSILGVDACHNEAIISIYPNDFILKKYLFIFLPVISNWGVQVNALMGKTLNKGKIQNLKIPIPPLQEQKAIVAIVEELFAEVEQLEQKTHERIQLKKDYVTSALHNLSQTTDVAKTWQDLQTHFATFFNEKANIKSLRESILQLAVQGKLTANWRKKNKISLFGGAGGIEPASELLKRITAEKKKLIDEKKIKKEKPLPKITEDEKPFDLPEGWVWCRMGSISDIQRGSSPRPKGDPRYFSENETNNRWISIKDISKYADNNVLKSTDEYLTNEGINYSRHVNAKELIVAVSGSTTGKCCLTGIEGYIYDGLAVVRLIGNYINPNYHLFYYLQLYNHMNSSKFGAAFPNINTKFLNEMMFPFPPLEEQKAIVKIVNQLMDYCDGLEREVEQRDKYLEDLMASCLVEMENTDSEDDMGELGMVGEEREKYK